MFAEFHTCCDVLIDAGYSCYNKCIFKLTNWHVTKNGELSRRCSMAWRLGAPLKMYPVSRLWHGPSWPDFFWKLGVYTRSVLFLPWCTLGLRKWLQVASRLRILYQKATMPAFPNLRFWRFELPVEREQSTLYAYVVLPLAPQNTSWVRPIIWLCWLRRMAKCYLYSTCLKYTDYKVTRTILFVYAMTNQIFNRTTLSTCVFFFLNDTNIHGVNLAVNQYHRSRRHGSRWQSGSREKRELSRSVWISLGDTTSWLWFVIAKLDSHVGQRTYLYYHGFQLVILKYSQFRDSEAW